MSQILVTSVAIGRSVDPAPTASRSVVKVSGSMKPTHSNVTVRSPRYSSTNS